MDIDIFFLSAGRSMPTPPLIGDGNLARTMHKFFTVASKPSTLTVLRSLMLLAVPYSTPAVPSVARLVRTAFSTPRYENLCIIRARARGYWMKAVIMAGGFGTRFWPVSREERPKQFLEIAGSNGRAARRTATWRISFGASIKLSSGMKDSPEGQPRMLHPAMLQRWPKAKSRI